MDVQSAPPTYTPMGMPRPPAGNPPVLGQQVPGMSGGLPAQGGLSVLQNPMAQELQSQGRQGDSTLVHMNPEEVSGLQALALSQGTSMTINPVTGLPEAFSLGKVFKKLLPTLVGVGMNFILPGSGLAIKGLSTAMQAGLMTGLGSFALTGSLKKGLMAGLGAYGGASMAGGIQSAMAKPPVGIPPGGPSVVPGSPIFDPAAASAIPSTAPTLAGAPASLAAPASTSGITASAFNPAFTPAATFAGATNAGLAPALTASALPSSAASAAASGAAQAAGPGVLSRFATGFANTARGPMTGLAGKAAVPLAIAGSTQALNAFSPGVKTSGGQIDNSYLGPYTPEQRVATFAPDTQSLLSSSKERRYFNVDMPAVFANNGAMVQPGSNTPGGTPILQPILNSKAKKGQNMYDWQYVPYMGAQNQPQSLQDAIAQQYPGYSPNKISGYNAGGEVHLKPGGFVVDARTTSGAGEGDTISGQAALAKLGGIPLNGPGNGVSDSINARIGDQPARVATGEVYMPPEAVKRIGKGDEKRGAKKLYAMMDRAHQATKRGQKQNILKGLA